MGLHEKINNYLASVEEATAKQIAAAIKMDDTPSRVVAALNEMRTMGTVECEKKKGKGNEYWYWVTQAAVAPAMYQPVAATPKAKDEKPASGSLVDELRQTIRQLTAERDVLRNQFTSIESDRQDAREQLHLAENACNAWYALAAEYECKSIPDLRVFIESALAKLDAAKPAQKPQAARTPRLPFSITGLAGYHTAPGKVTLFLDRRLSARSITLDASKLQQLADMARGDA